MKYIRLSWFNYCLVAIALSSNAVASDPANGGAAGHDKAPHNGQFIAVGEYHIEMLAKDNELTIYLTDHEWKPKNVDGATGKVLILSNKEKKEISITPEKDNLITAKGQFTSAADMKVVLTLNLPNEKAMNARFTPLAK